HGVYYIAAACVGYCLGDPTRSCSCQPAVRKRIGETPRLCRERDRPQPFHSLLRNSQRQLAIIGVAVSVYRIGKERCDAESNDHEHYHCYRRFEKSETLLLLFAHKAHRPP